MAAAVDVDGLNNFLECAICLQKFDTPKLLWCAHHFCKQCLEGIIIIMKDGSGVITCPMRCNEKTIVGKDQTINDLTASYELKGILEALKGKDGGSESEAPVCTYDKSCTKDISMYCCKTVMCNSCFKNHEKTGGCHKKKTHLFFSERENKLKVLCTKHDSLCTHLCEDNMFLCMYCLNRDPHKKHSKYKIEAEVTLLRKALIKDKKEKEGVDKFRKATEESIRLIKRKLEDLLEARKEECLKRYNDFLNEEEEMLKRNLQSICSKHMNQYLHMVPEYYTDKLKKCDAELAIEKSEILNKISKNENLSLNCATVSLSDNFDFLSKLPLGDLKVTAGEKIMLKDLPVSPVSTLRDTMISKVRKRNIMQASATANDLKPKSIRSSTVSGKNLGIVNRDAKGKIIGNDPFIENFDITHWVTLMPPSTDEMNTGGYTSIKNKTNFNTTLSVPSEPCSSGGSEIVSTPLIENENETNMDVTHTAAHSTGESGGNPIIENERNFDITDWVSSAPDNNTGESNIENNPSVRNDTNFDITDWLN